VNLLEALPPTGRAPEPPPAQVLRAIGRLTPQHPPGKEHGRRARFDRRALWEQVATRIRGDGLLEGVLGAVHDVRTFDELIEEKLSGALDKAPRLEAAWWGEVLRTLGEWRQGLEQARQGTTNASPRAASSYDLIAIPCLYEHWLCEGRAGRSASPPAVEAAEDLVRGWLESTARAPRAWDRVPKEHEFVLRCAALSVVLDRFVRMIRDYHEERRRLPGPAEAGPEESVPNASTSIP
jgi:hypothetical protein